MECARRQLSDWRGDRTVEARSCRRSGDRVPIRAQVKGRPPPLSMHRYVGRIAGRLRSVILVAAAVIGLLAAVPQLVITSGSGSRVEQWTQLLHRQGLGTCAPGVARCDPVGPASLATPAWMGATFVAVGVTLMVAAFWPRRRIINPPLARGIPAGIDRPPQLLASSH